MKDSGDSIVKLSALSGLLHDFGKITRKLGIKDNAEQDRTSHEEYTYSELIGDAYDQFVIRAIRVAAAHHKNSRQRNSLRESVYKKIDDELSKKALISVVAADRTDVLGRVVDTYNIKDDYVWVDKEISSIIHRLIVDFAPNGEYKSALKIALLNLAVENEEDIVINQNLIESPYTENLDRTTHPLSNSNKHIGYELDLINVSLPEKQLYNILLEQLKKVLKKTRESNVYNMIYTLESLIKELAWRIPTYKYVGPEQNLYEKEIYSSLYTHLKATAAIAAVGAALHRGENLRELGKVEFKPFLIKGSIKNIQEFIKQVFQETKEEGSEKNVLKNVRGRSIIINSLCKGVALYICHKLGLPPTNILIVGGGNFLILSHKNPDGELVNNIKTKIEKDYWPLQLIVDSEPIRYEYKNAYFDEDSETVKVYEISGIKEALSALAEREDKKRFSLNGVFSVELNRGTDIKRLCRSCNVRHVEDIDKDDQNCKVCKVAVAVGKIASQVVNSSGSAFSGYVLFYGKAEGIKGEEIINFGDDFKIIAMEIKSDNGIIKIFDENAEGEIKGWADVNLDVDDASKWSTQEGFLMALMDVITASSNVGVSLSFRLRTAIEGTHMFFDEKHTHKHIAYISLDIDNLGKINRDLVINSKFPLADYIELYTYMDYAVRKVAYDAINEILNDGGKFYPVYVGGDDIMLITDYFSATHILIRSLVFSLEEIGFIIKEGKNAGRKIPAFTFSGGIFICSTDFPFRYAYEESQYLEKLAKDQSYNKFSVAFSIFKERYMNVDIIKPIKMFNYSKEVLALSNKAGLQKLPSSFLFSLLNIEQKMSQLGKKSLKRRVIHLSKLYRIYKRFYKSEIDEETKSFLEKTPNLENQIKAEILKRRWDDVIQSSRSRKTG